MNNLKTEPRNVKCVVVGDGAVGKTCLLMSYCMNQFLNAHVPTVCETFSKKVFVDNSEYNISFFDTAGQEEFDRLRVLSYHNTDVFLVCFSVVRPYSYDNIKSIWLPEILHHTPNAKFILVGTQIDLRVETLKIKELLAKNLKPITFQQGEKLAKETKAFIYAECSSLTQKGLNNVIEQVLNASKVQKNVRKRCIFL
jgi:cell division control protein 42